MAIQKIKVQDLRLGMFIVRFEGAWLDNPFWTSQFLLDSSEDMRTARASGLDEVWIDSSRGTAPDAGVRRFPAALPRSTHTVVHKRPKPLEPALSFEAELENAKKICGVARDAIVTMFQQVRLGRAVDHGASHALVDEIVASVARHNGALISLARLKSEDDYTYMHSVAVCALMIALARAMRLSDVEVREAGLGGLLHDIGKARIPLAVLNKPGSLDDAEYALVKRHPEHGYEALAQGLASTKVREVCLYHHERLDGTGYPAGKAGELIPLMARMGAVCDVYDAVTSDRPYKRGWDPADALANMISWKGHFDPAVLAAFIEVVGIYPTGSLVRLKSGHLAVVIEQNSARYTRPVVRLFYCTAKRKTVPPLKVNLALDEDEIIGREDRTGWPAELIEKLWAGDLAS